MYVPQQTAMNDDKIEVLLFARKGLATEHLPKSIKIDDTAINFVPMLRDLGVTLDSSLSFSQQVMNTCRSAGIFGTETYWFNS